MTEFRINPTQKRSSIGIVIIIIIVGVVLLAMGVYQNIDRSNKKEYYIATTGVLVDEEVSRSDRDLSAPVYEYQVEGQTYSYNSSVSTNGSNKTGQEVTIRYNPSNPNEAFVDSAVSPSVLLIALGGLFLLAGTLGLVSNAKSLDKSKRDFLIGINAGLMFMGFPIILMIFIPGMTILVRIVLIVFVLIGVYLLFYFIYSTYFDKKFDPYKGISENETIQNTLGKISSIRNDEEFQENKSRLKDVVFKAFSTFSLIKTIIGIIALIAIAVFLIILFINRR